MALSPEVLGLLHQRYTLAACAPAPKEGWHAWVWVRPIMRCGRTFKEAVEECTRAGCASGPYDGTIERFQARYVELSDWHLADSWYLDMDIAMRERRVVDEWREVVDEDELAGLLVAWGIDSAALDDPARVNYPDPPRV